LRISETIWVKRIILLAKGALGIKNSLGFDPMVGVDLIRKQEAK